MNHVQADHRQAEMTMFWTSANFSYRVTVWELAKEIEVSNEKSVCKICSKVADNGANQLHLEIAQDILDSVNSNPDFLNIVITGDESWIYG